MNHIVFEKNRNLELTLPDQALAFEVVKASSVFHNYLSKFNVTKYYTIPVQLTSAHYRRLLISTIMIITCPHSGNWRYWLDRHEKLIIWRSSPYSNGKDLFRIVI